MPRHFYFEAGCTRSEEQPKHADQEWCLLAQQLCDAEFTLIRSDMCP